MKVTNKDYTRVQNYFKPKAVIKLFSIDVGIKYLWSLPPLPAFYGHNISKNHLYKLNIEILNN